MGMWVQPLTSRISKRNLCWIMLSLRSIKCACFHRCLLGPKLPPCLGRFAPVLPGRGWKSGLLICARLIKMHCVLNWKLYVWRTTMCRSTLTNFRLLWKDMTFNLVTSIGSSSTLVMRCRLKWGKNLPLIGTMTTFPLWRRRLRRCDFRTLLMGYIRRRGRTREVLANLGVMASRTVIGVVKVGTWRVPTQ